VAISSTKHQVLEMLNDKQEDEHKHKQREREEAPLVPLVVVCLLLGARVSAAAAARKLPSTLCSLCVCRSLWRRSSCGFVVVFSLSFSSE